nr:unnamed protein product [Spirometra erinaceieuropaei]
MSQGINERLMAVCPPLQESKFPIILSAYVPQRPVPMRRSKFCKDLNTLPVTVPNANKSTILGDIDARFGQTPLLLREYWVPVDSATATKATISCKSVQNIAFS